MKKTEQQKMANLRFVCKERSSFYRTVTKRVNDYFKDNNISKYGNGTMYLKSLLFIGGTVLLYSLIISEIFSPWVMFGLALILGCFKAFIGFNVCHDAIHGSYSPNKVVNKMFGLVFNAIGANDYVWKITHNLVHHTYTNIPGHDEDIDVAPGLVRLSPAEEWKKHMKYQHFYAFPLYGLASLSWVFRKDFKKFFQKNIGQVENTTHEPIEYFNLFFFKAFYYTVFIVVPILVMDITVWQFLFGFIFMHVAEGLVLGLVFQLAHVVEGTDFPEPSPESGNIEEDWAVHQMQTTANFARKSHIANFLCGGLNFQVEHHLFPNICHVHYREISDIVKATAHEFNLPYHENETFGKALVSHYNTLKLFGHNQYKRKEVAATVA
ncbi:fatty acid desaturase family protein [Chondrinema litorale]|uniref:fatty acid desaturase family protein n=1 Tax=Chondrinema litorale TaxID=2994555 RepID=UPI002543922D|nr:fatty acid desaturase [Chondrinema litorale]UZR94139.1 fatty acid desaturase [Chondrinema litorale]